MTFGQRIVGALKLDANTFEDIERDPTAMGQSVGVIALAALAGSLGHIWGFGFGAMVIAMVAALVGYALWAVVVWLVGTKVMPDPETKADFPEAFRVIGFAASPGLLGAISIIPLIGTILMFLVTPIVWLWSMAIMVVAVRQVLDYKETFKAVIVVIIGFVAFLIFWFTMAMMSFGAAMVGGMLSR